MNQNNCFGAVLFGATTLTTWDRTPGPPKIRLEEDQETRRGPDPCIAVSTSEIPPTETFFKTEEPEQGRWHWVPPCSRAHA